MKKTSLFIGWILVVSSGGCIATDGGGFSLVGTSSQMTSASVAPPAKMYTGPKIKIAVLDFENKASQATTIGIHGGQTVIESDPVGRGMAEQMTTALMQTGMFTVIDPEISMTNSGGVLPSAKYLLRGAVTEFQASQSNVGLGGGFNALGGYGSKGGGWLTIATQAFSAMSKRDHVAIDLRLVDAKTGEVVAATSIDSKAQDFGGALGGMFGSTLLGVSGEYRTPTAKAVRACCIKAANWLGQEMLARDSAVVTAN